MGTSTKVFSGVAAKFGEATAGGTNRQVQPDTSAIPKPKSGADPEKAKQRLQEIRDSQITYIHKLEGAGQDTLQIGDLIFGMPNTKHGALTPPIAINVNKQALNFKWQTLRTDTSVKVASGKSNARISLSLYFVGTLAINNGLRRLIATFNSLPFVYVENSFIRSNLAPDNWGNMACSLVGLNIRTEQGLPNVLAADLDLLWFNYKPYANNFWFRQRWESVLELKDNVANTCDIAAATEGIRYKSPAESNLTGPLHKEDPVIAYSNPAIQPLESKPLQDHVERRLGPAMGELSNSITFTYKDYKSISGFDLSGTVTPGKINPDYLRPVDTTHMRSAVGSRPVFMLHPAAAKILEELAERYNFETGKRLVVSDCFRTREMQIAKYTKNKQNAAPPGKSWHEAGLAVDVPITGHQIEANYIIFQRLIKQVGLKQLGTGTVRWNDDGSSPYNENYSPPWETWHYDFIDLQTKYRKELPGSTVKKLVLKIYYSNTTSGTTGTTLAQHEQEKRNKEYEGSVEAKIEELRIAGYEIDIPSGAGERIRSSSSSRLMFSKPKVFKIFEHDPELVPQGISIAKHNIIPQLPIESHEYATQQYLGSTDMDAVISFSSVSEERLRELQAIIETLQRNSRADRELRESAVLDIQNSLFNFVGFDRALIENISVRSVPGSPGLYDITLQLTQYKTPKPRLQQEKTIPGSAWLKIAEYVFEHLISLNSVKVQNYLHYLVAEQPYPTGLSIGNQVKLLRIIGQKTSARASAFGFFTPFAQKQIIAYWGGAMKTLMWMFDNDTSPGSIIAQYATILGEAIGNNLHPTLASRLGMDSQLSWINWPDSVAWYQSLPYTKKIAEVPDDTDFALFQRLQARLRMLGSRIVQEQLFQDIVFSGITDEITQYIAQATPGTECYPDLKLPPHVVTKLTRDTPPDYWFYNELIDGTLFSTYSGEETLEEAKQVMRRAYTFVDKAMDPEEWRNRQLSYNKPEIFDKILSGNTGRTGAKIQIAASSKDGAGLGKAKKEDYDKELIEPIVKPKSLNKTSNLHYPRNSVDYEKLPDTVSFGKRKAGRDELDSDPSITWDTVSGQDSRKLDTIFEQSFAHFNKNMLSFARAFPTFKIYFIEDDSEDFTAGNMRNFDDFYSYSAIKDIRIVRSRKIPADLCVISIANIHGELDTLAYRSGDDPSSSEHIVEKFDPTNVDTAAENPFSKLVVVEGSKIQVRLGYSNDPDGLETVFNGQVVEVGVSPICPDIIQLVCQSYAVELIAAKKNEGRFDTTQELLSAMMCSPEVLHFGRWSRNAVYDPREMRTGRDGTIQPGFLGLSTGYRRFREAVLGTWNFLNDPRDDNIFAPSDFEYSTWAQNAWDTVNILSFKSAGEFLGILEDEREYYPRDVTVWDIFKEMELRHPGFISSPVPYANRYTMFFGAPSDLYWSRPMNEVEKRGWKKILKIDAILGFAHKYQTTGLSQIAHKDIWHYAAIKGKAGIYDKPIETVSYWLGDTVAGWYKKQVEWLLKKRMERFTPFRKYHYLSSRHNIIANNIYASAHGTYNATDLVYMKDVIPYELEKVEGGAVPFSTERIFKAMQEKAEHFEMKADDNIEDKDTRVLEGVYPSCFGEYYATRYAVSSLMRSLKDIYKGEIVVTGDASIKPYDAVWISDDYRDIYGMVEVEQVTHIFSHETGFVTEIKPDLIVSHDSATTQCALEGMWNVATKFFESFHSRTGTIGTIVLGAGLAAGSLLVGKIGMLLAALGGFRMVLWSQARQPLFITPLIQNGKPLIAGLHGYKNDTLWVNLKGRFEKFTGNTEEGWNVLIKSSLVGDKFKELFAN